MLTLYIRWHSHSYETESTIKLAYHVVCLFLFFIGPMLHFIVELKTLMVYNTNKNVSQGLIEVWSLAITEKILHKHL